MIPENEHTDSGENLTPSEPPETEPASNPISFRSFANSVARDRKEGSWFKTVGLMIVAVALIYVGWAAHEYVPKVKVWITSGILPLATPTPEPPIQLDEPQVTALLQEIVAEQKRVSEEKYRLQDRIDQLDLTWKVLRKSGYGKDANECKEVFKEAKEFKKNLNQVDGQLAKLNESATGLREALHDIRLQGSVTINPKTQHLVSNVEIALGVRKELNNEGVVIPDRDWNGEDPDEFMKSLKGGEQVKPAPTQTPIKIPAAAPINSK